MNNKKLTLVIAVSPPANLRELKDVITDVVQSDRRVYLTHSGPTLKSTDVQSVSLRAFRAGILLHCRQEIGEVLTSAFWSQRLLETSRWMRGWLRKLCAKELRE